MKEIQRYFTRIVVSCFCFSILINIHAQSKQPLFKVIAFYSAKSDLAHISFVREANKWFPEMAALYNFSYDSTNNWSNLNESFLSQYQVVIFLDTRPEKYRKEKPLRNIWIMAEHLLDFILPGLH